MPKQNILNLNCRNGGMKKNYVKRLQININNNNNGNDNNYNNDKQQDEKNFQMRCP